MYSIETFKTWLRIRYHHCPRSVNVLTSLVGRELIELASYLLIIRKYKLILIFRHVGTVQKEGGERGCIILDDSNFGFHQYIDMEIGRSLN